MNPRALVVIVVLLLVSGVARAQDKPEVRAAELFRAGSAAYERGDYKAAARAFEEANRQAPAAAAEYNAGLAWQAAGDKLRAAGAYEHALSVGGLADAQARDARRRLGALDAALGHLHVVAPDGARIAVDRAACGTAPIDDVRVQPGRHLVTMQIGSRHEERTVDAVSGAATQVRFQLAVAPESPSPPAASASRPPSPATAEQPTTTGSSRRTWGWVGVGGGVVLAGGAVALGLGALHARDQFDKSGHTDAGAHDRAANLRLWTNVAWVGAAVVGGTGIVLLVTAPSHPEAARAGFVLGPGSVSLRGRF